MSRVEFGRGQVVSGGALRRHRMGFKPKRAGGRKRIYLGLLPPRPFIAAAMDLPVMHAT
jgi:hypothetical protein